jgi:hypothetical protein
MQPAPEAAAPEPAAPEAAEPAEVVAVAHDDDNEEGVPMVFAIVLVTKVRKVG